MDEIKPHHWITSVGRMSRRKPPKQCQSAAYYDQQSIDTLRAEVEENEAVIRVWRGRTMRAEAEADALRKALHDIESCTTCDAAMGISGAALNGEYK